MTEDGQSTGGFSTLDDSIAGYNSYAMELVHVPAMITPGINWEVSRVFLPGHAVEDLRIGQRTFKADEANDEIRAAATFAFTYLLLLGLSLFVFLAVVPSELTFADAIFEVATAQGTVGLSSALISKAGPVSVPNGRFSLQATAFGNVATAWL